VTGDIEKTGGGAGVISRRSDRLLLIEVAETEILQVNNWQFCSAGHGVFRCRSTDYTQTGDAGLTAANSDHGAGSTLSPWL